MAIQYGRALLCFQQVPVMDGQDPITMRIKQCCGTAFIQVQQVDRRLIGDSMHQFEK